MKLYLHVEELQEEKIDIIPRTRLKLNISKSRRHWPCSKPHGNFNKMLLILTQGQKSTTVSLDININHVHTIVASMLSFFPIETMIPLKPRTCAMNHLLPFLENLNWHKFQYQYRKTQKKKLHIKIAKISKSLGQV